MSRWVNFNPNPIEGKRVGDCQVRALCKALDMEWNEAYDEIATEGYNQKDIPSANAVWGEVLRQHGFERKELPYEADVFKFCCNFPEGVYVLGLDGHVVTVVDGRYYDTWDSGEKRVIHYWER